jgi:hypothetical protein
MAFPVTEHVVKTARHTSFYLACGPEHAPAIIFVHGWPALSVSWRHQLPAFAALGFRAMAPDMRGYGRSSVYERHEDYALEQQGAWVKDDLGWGFGLGNGIGSLITDCSALTTNFGANVTSPTSNFTVNRALYDSGVRSRTNPCFGAHVDALHWWTEELRTNLTFGMMHQDIAYNLVMGTTCIATGSSTAAAANNNCGASGATLNKELDLAVVNLIWSPVSFVDMGIEYAWGHRDTLANLRGNAYVLSGALKVKF